MKYLLILFVLLTGCTSHMKKTQALRTHDLELFELTQEKPIATYQNQNIPYGGLSGLLFIGRNNDGDPEFYTLTDRGPNAEEIKKDKKTYRPFLTPNFQPRILKITLKQKSKTAIVTDEIPLFLKPKLPLSGRPNISEDSAKNGLKPDEIPWDMNHKLLPYDPMGIDPESIAIDEQRRFWIGEEYRPSILVFDDKGLLQTRLIPKNSYPIEIFTQSHDLKKNQVRAVLPEAYQYRRLNRGFEALTYANGKIFAMTQSPLEIPGRVNTNIIRILVINAINFEPEAEYLYEINTKKADKIGDMIALSEKNFLVIEQNGKLDDSAAFDIYEIDLSKSSNVLNHKIPPEKIEMKDLKSQFQLVEKKLFLNLVLHGYNFAEKIEGLTLTDQQEIVITNDNDFSLQDNQLTPSKKTIFGVFKKIPTLQDSKAR